MTGRYRSAAFSITVACIALMLVGAALIPRLSVRLQPSQAVRTLSVRYNWHGASPRLIEQEVTAPLEGLFGTIRGITKITSSSQIGSGYITLEYDKQSDPDAIRFEIASKIREAYPSFPEEVRYPVISAVQQETDEQILLAYNLYAPASPLLIQTYAEDFIKPRLADIPGLYRIRVSGATAIEWELEYNQDQLLTLGLSQQTILTALQGYFREEVIGMGWDHAGGIRIHTPHQIVLRTYDREEIDWKKIPVARVAGRVFRIRDLCQIRKREQEPTGYFRINGQNTITLRFSAERSANSLDVVRKIKQRLGDLSADFPPGYQISLSYDSTEFIQAELRKILLRTIFSFTILLLFVLLISRQIRYLFIIFICLIANLLTAVILYYVVGVEINLYALAGITVSLGIIIDNTIVMVDHIRTKGNQRVFLAILAATLTTIGALSVIRFFGEQTRLMLKDFSMVLIINLFVSLLVALFLAPSLMDLIGISRREKRLVIKRKRWIILFNRFYLKTIRFSQRYRWAYVIVAILLFGIPVFMLPVRMEGDEWYHKLYRATLASDTYVQKIKPVTDKVLGGTLRLFSTKVYERYSYRMPERTRISVRASLPQGAILEQMNDLMVGLERYLTGKEQIDQFTTNIYGPRQANLEVSFNPEYELGAFPFILYDQLQDYANKQTGADWWVHGIGQGFSNSLSERVGSQQITLYGYNFDELWEYAEVVKAKVLTAMRVERASIMSERTWTRDPVTEYRMHLNPEKLRLFNTDRASIYQYLQGYAIQPHAAGRLIVNQRYEPVSMHSTQSNRFDIWMMGETPVQRDSTLIRLSELGDLNKEEVNKTIVKEDQQYRLIVEYDYNGAAKMATMHREQVIKEVSELLPIGYLVKESDYRYWQREKNRQFLLILLVIGIIYMICSILLESLTQPLAVVLIIPVSFVGVFLTFYLFNFSFDQGGFASFLLLSGIVVNASLYILNDYNNHRKNPGEHRLLPALYLKAFQGKIIPIFLTVMSTVLGLVPFVTAGQSEVFWFALAVGTMGGLIFSVFALLVFLPAFLGLPFSIPKTQSKNNKTQ